MLYHCRMKKSKHSPAKILKALDDVKRGMSISCAAQKHNIPRSSLGSKVNSAGITSVAQKHLSNIASMKEEAKVLRSNGASYPAIVDAVGCSYRSAVKWCKNILLTDQQKMANSRAKVDLQKKAVEYRRSGMYIAEIAQKLGCSKGSVCLWLKNAQPDCDELDVKVQQRKIMESASRKTKVSLNEFGPKIISCADEIIRLRKGGKSYQEIGCIVGVNKTDIGRFCRQQNFSEEEKRSISLAVHKSVMERRHRGELKSVGGFRQGAERSKSGYYKGIYCSSTYELCWVIYNLDHGNQFQRFSGFLQHPKQRFKYYPDFLIGDNHIIEIKGYENKKEVARKTRLAKSLGYQVTLVKKDDLRTVFDYVDQQYGVKYNNRHTLYDNHKPSLLLMCSFCGCEFERFKQRKTDQKLFFCNPSCGGKHRSKINKMKAKSELS